MFDPHHIQLVWRPFGKHETKTNQGDAWTPKVVWVWFYIGDLTFRVSALILVLVGRGARTCPLRLVWWSQLMPRGGTCQHMHYPPQFFLMVDDYTYVGTDFRWDPDLPLHQENSGSMQVKTCFLDIFMFYVFFMKV